MAGGAGLSPFAPGTAGAAVGVLLFLVLGRLPAPLYLLTTGTLVVLAVWVSDVAGRAFGGETDDSRIVIDEVVGQLVALTPLVSGRATWPLVVTGFVAFRVLDVWKPGPIGRAERSLRGGLGVVMDDVLAGVLSGVLVGALVLAGFGAEAP